MSPLDRESIASVTLGKEGGKSPLLLPALVAVAIHGAVVAVALLNPTNALEAPGRPLPDRVIELAAAPEPAPPPPSAPEPEPEPEPPAKTPAPAPRPVIAKAVEPAAPQTPPPAPSQAGKVLTRSEEAEPVDFGDLGVVTGESDLYAGGKTATGGTSKRAVHSEAVALGGTPDGPAGKGSQARPIGLLQARWTCPWPKDATALRSESQEVLLRLVVGPDGSVLGAEVVDDPGHGFGEEALRCARSTRFEPALDVHGKPMLASAPIRVRFTRSR